MAGIVDPKEGIVTRGASLREAIRVIEESRKTIAVVIDENRRLLGTVSDGDIRRAILAGKTLDAEVTEAMNRQPRTTTDDSSDSTLLQFIRKYDLEAVPVVDGDRRLRRVVHVNELMPGDAVGGAEGFDAAVIMAGGEGRRLRPLTDSIPKPMVNVGGVPLIERLVKRIARAGVRSIYVAVNYLADVIENHLGDGSRFGASIIYLREQRKMGTAGALSLLPETPRGPLLVINGDIVTTSEFKNFLRFHMDYKAAVTVGAVTHRVQIPYGVIRCDGMHAVALEEKPSQFFLCNAGIYVVSPDVLRFLPDGEPYNMTELMQRCILERCPVVVFPIHEYWSDIGTPSDLQEALVSMGAMDQVVQ